MNNLVYTIGSHYEPPLCVFTDKNKLLSFLTNPENSNTVMGFLIIEYPANSYDYSMEKTYTIKEFIKKYEISNV